MNTWIIEPHDSFVARDGRPFGLIAGVRATSLPFPFPSTTTGGARTREGLDEAGVFDATRISEIKNLRVWGPLLVELDDDGGIARWFAPAPADALLLDRKELKKESAMVRRLLPRQLLEGAATNMPDGILPLYLPREAGANGNKYYDKRKPHGYAPRFWNWKRFEQWLTEPGDFEIARLADFGISTVPQDERSHVGIDRDSQTSEQGMLFQTRGLEFTNQKQKREDDTFELASATRLALAIHADGTNINEGAASLGGERRLVSWRRVEDSTAVFDGTCPIRILKSVITNRSCRVALLTPACFEQGWQPKWLTEGRAGLNGNLAIALTAAAVNRYQVVSGWDFENQRPKPTRRLAPAGSVFFLKLQGTEQEITDWASAVWMRCVSDDEQSRLDGFGLAVLGVWPEGKDVN